MKKWTVSYQVDYPAEEVYGESEEEDIPAECAGDAIRKCKDGILFSEKAEEKTEEKAEEKAKEKAEESGEEILIREEGEIIERCHHFSAKAK